MEETGFTAVILAGGESRRMGRDKAFLPWGDTTLLKQIVKSFLGVADEVIVAVKDRRRFRNLAARVVEDLIPNAHALGGLYTGLRAAKHERCFVTSCDAPFLDLGLVRFLVGELDGVDLVIPKTAKGLQPLHAAYARSCLTAIEEKLRRRQWDLAGLIPKVRARVVSVKGGLSFRNLNTPADYRRAFYSAHSPLPASRAKGWAAPQSVKRSSDTACGVKSVKGRTASSKVERPTLAMNSRKLSLGILLPL